jgi:hypothetical protein
MAFVYISEYDRMHIGPDGRASIPSEPALAEQQVAIAAGSTQGVAFNVKTRYIRVSTDAVVSIKIGVNPTAVNTQKRMPANATEYFALDRLIDPTTMKLATITNT